MVIGGILPDGGEAVQPLVKLGYSVLVMDYRGYGKSTGKRTKQSLFDDAQLWYDWLKKEYEEEEIVIYGRSIGTGIASWLASQNNPSQLLLETPYYSLAEMAKRYYPMYPAKYALRFNFQSFKYLELVECPLVIFHGTEDFVVPYHQGKRLFEEASIPDKKFYTIEGGEHKNLIEFEDFREAMRQVL